LILQDELEGVYDREKEDLRRSKWVKN
jgi:hypothetical protein